MRRRVLLLLSFALAVSVVWPVHAAEVSVKSLSGPPEELAAHRWPSEEETAVPSKLLVVDRGTRVSSTTYSSFSTTPGVGFSLIQVTTQFPYFAPAIITAPNGSRYEFNGYSIVCNFGYCGEYQADLQMEAFTTQAPGGVAILSISGGEVSGGSWDLAVQDPTVPPLLSSVPLQVESILSFDDNVVEVVVDPDPCPPHEICPVEPFAGERRNAVFDLVDGAAPVLKVSFLSKELKSKNLRSGISLAALRVTVTDTRTRTTFHQEQLSLARLASLPVDSVGASLVQLPSLPVGEYSVRLDIEGNIPGVGPIERTAFYFLPIIARRYRLTGEVQAEVVDKERLKIVLDLERLVEDRRHVYAYAEVWTKDGSQPIAWIGGMTQPEPSPSGRLGLPLLLDARWLALAEARESEYLLRNVRIQDPDTFIPIAQAAELPFAVRELPGAAFLEKAGVVKDDSLYIGKGDQTISVDGAEADSPSPSNFSNTGIFLIHGWCSNPVWPLSHFGRPGRVGGTEIFNNFGASLSHDAFARQIRDQGAANFANSFTAVAHSQGGAAAVHLRSFYSSLLDNSTAPRRIQTMGTPYGGSTLMDFYLATGPLGWLIADIFGACSPQFDLGTLGSALWSSNIPGWARNDVYYYRTGYQRARTFWDKLQFWRWRCNAASFVIPSWDDGVVADFQGFFSGAHDMGITEGECHTAGMNHGPQTNNFGRNDILDREGRPSLVNQARSAAASASSSYTPGCTPGLHCYFPSRVNDGDRSTTLGGNTSWANNNGQPMPQWVQLHWPSAITFSRVNLYLTSGYEISSFRVEYRASASAPWQLLVAVSGNSTTTLGPYNVPFPGTATAQDIRVLGLSGPSIQPGYIRVNEIEVY
jgi:hypothetical protein